MVYKEEIMEDIKKIEKAIASLAKTDRKALAELITEYVAPNHYVTNLVGLFLNTRTLNPGDILVKKVRKGIEVRTLIPGSIHLASEITVADRANYILDGLDVKITANDWEIESGQLGTVESMKAEARAKLSDYYVERVFTALSTIWNSVNTPSNYTSVGGEITKTALEDAIDQINYRTGGVRAVVGTRKALTPITKFAGWYGGKTDTAWGVGVTPAIEELWRTGFLGSYYGSTIVAMDQVWNNPVDYQPMLPEDKILVIGQNAGEFILYGPAREKEYTDPRPTPSQWIWETWQQYGLIVDFAQGIYVIGGLS